MIVDLPHTVTSSLYSTFFLPLSHPLFFIKSATPQQATGNHQVRIMGKRENSKPYDLEDRTLTSAKKERAFVRGIPYDL